MARNTLKKNKGIFSYLLGLYLLPFLIILTIPFVCEPMDFSIDMFTRDTNAIAGTHPFVGLVSNIGIIIWTLTAAVSLFSGIIIFICSNKKKIAAFLLFSGLVTTQLMIDDFFQLHEVIYKCYFGIDEKVIFAIYIILVIMGLIIFRRIILETRSVILISACVFFVLSLLVDHFHYYVNGIVGPDIRILLEDGLKLFGIVGWFGFFARFSYFELEKLIRSKTLQSE